MNRRVNLSDGFLEAHPLVPHILTLRSSLQSVRAFSTSLPPRVIISDVVVVSVFMTLAHFAPCHRPSASEDAVS